MHDFNGTTATATAEVITGGDEGVCAELHIDGRIVAADVLAAFTISNGERVLGAWVALFDKTGQAWVTNTNSGMAWPVRSAQLAVQSAMARCGWDTI